MDIDMKQVGDALKTIGSDGGKKAVAVVLDGIAELRKVGGVAGQLGDEYARLLEKLAQDFKNDRISLEAFAIASDRMEMAISEVAEGTKEAATRVAVARARKLLRIGTEALLAAASVAVKLAAAGL